ncbi:PalH/RIM21-domain-containing protein [Neohortaea acidophila]|uniref:PalH/RIM21-domain-containing protein n=1 Tax=Neohortaea acidophila TaxID=245834 RepID=A0A6A6Q466_9PEZI|nr:PalH/RIM21-domain-containing protein [Neohortaea acidophila]KAF2486187.1 PalH/RIM21-domain-containing protein [Neohortaea acidophila]
MRRPTPLLPKRQLWGTPTTSSTTFLQHCTPFSLPSNGVIAFAGTAITLTTDAIFNPECTGVAIADIASIASGEPFYASTIPQTYVIAAATVIAWILVVMLLITPRTNFLGQSGTAPGFSSGHGIIGGSTGANTDLIGIGSRPWLQKVAAFTCAISLTIATADTFKFASRQYAVGYIDALVLRDEVLGSLEIRIMRVITDVFIWLAQVQTLIRLFPRHKEKVLIKWIGFALILFDSVFSCLNAFVVKPQHTPRQFYDAIPALSYLFELAVGLLYAAWVIYYSMTKRRYAFYHSKMPSIGLVALLSLTSILTPVVFFVTDVSNSDVASWGDYFRWVGAAAASVVVWEWVERIEALERDEKKDGILGREIFDGDEMLDITPSDEVVWVSSRRARSALFRRDDDRDEDGGGTQSSALEKGLTSVAQRFRIRTKASSSPDTVPSGQEGTTQVSTSTMAEVAHPTNPSPSIKFGALPRPQELAEAREPSDITPPSRVISPISRADTTSAASTVYVVQYNPAADVPQPVRRRVDPNGNTEQERAQAQARAQQRRAGNTADPEKEGPVVSEVEEPSHHRRRTSGSWLAVSNPFKRKRASPPAEVQQARKEVTGRSTTTATSTPKSSSWNMKNRMGVSAVGLGQNAREKKAGRGQSEELPVTIIPAQPRDSVRTWRPPDSSRLDAAAVPENTASNLAVSGEMSPRLSSTTSERASPAQTRSPTPRRSSVEDND